MPFKYLLFYFFAFSAVGSGLGIAVSSDIVRMAYWLIGLLISIAGLYFLEGAYFLGVIQIIVYAGGVAVLMVFGIMLTSRQQLGRLRPQRFEALLVMISGTALLAGIVMAIFSSGWPRNPVQPPSKVADVGLQLLGSFLGPFELASVLLLIALIGAAYLARPKVPTLKPEDSRR